MNQFSTANKYASIQNVSVHQCLTSKRQNRRFAEYLADK